MWKTWTMSRRTSSTVHYRCKLLCSWTHRRTRPSSPCKPAIPTPTTTFITSSCGTELADDLRSTSDPAWCELAALTSSNWTWNMCCTWRRRIRTARWMTESSKARPKSDSRLSAANVRRSSTCRATRRKFRRIRRKTQSEWCECDPLKPSDWIYFCSIISVKAKSFADREIRYTLKAQGQGAGTFNIGPSSGIVKLAKELDFEDLRQPHVYSLVVTATEDSGGFSTSVEVRRKSEKSFPTF